MLVLGISRDHWHKRRATGGKRKPLRKKRKFELGRPAANTKLGPRRIHYVRTRGGNLKYRALRLDTGNFAWGSEGTARKSRIIDVVYNASNNELVRTKTLVKNAIVVVDATPFRQWYEGHYVLPLGRKKGAKLVSLFKFVLFIISENDEFDCVSYDILCMIKKIWPFADEFKWCEAIIVPSCTHTLFYCRLLKKKPF